MRKINKEMYFGLFMQVEDIYTFVLIILNNLTLWELGTLR